MAGRATDQYRAAIWKATDLPSNDKFVALAMVEFMNHKTLGDARPGPELLKRRTGLSVSTVKRSLKRLVDSGWLVVVKKGGSASGRKLATIYAGHMPTSSNPCQTDTGLHVEPVSHRHGNPCQSDTPPSLRDGRPGRRVASDPDGSTPAPTSKKPSGLVNTLTIKADQ
jgi:hypothetical protein